jgi:hypothetical protein
MSEELIEILGIKDIGVADIVKSISKMEQRNVFAVADV